MELPDVCSGVNGNIQTHDGSLGGINGPSWWVMSWLLISSDWIQERGAEEDEFSETNWKLKSWRSAQRTFLWLAESDQLIRNNMNSCGTNVSHSSSSLLPTWPPLFRQRHLLCASAMTTNNKQQPSGVWSNLLAATLWSTGRHRLTSRRTTGCVTLPPPPDPDWLPTTTQTGVRTHADTCACLFCCTWGSVWWWTSGRHELFRDFFSEPDINPN